MLTIKKTLVKLIYFIHHYIHHYLIYVSLIILCLSGKIGYGGDSSETNGNSEKSLITENNKSEEDEKLKKYIKSLPVKEIKICFFNAIWSGDIKTVTNILSVYPKLIDTKDKFGRTALFFAISNKNKALIKLLIKQKASPNIANIYGETPLFEAVKTHKLSIVKYLVKHGAKISKTDKKGRTPLMKSAELGYIKIAEYFIKKGASVNKRDKYGNTALHLAARRGQYAMIKLLLRYNAYKHIKNKLKKTPYDITKNNDIKQLLK